MISSLAPIDTLTAATGVNNRPVPPQLTAASSPSATSSLSAASGVKTPSNQKNTKQLFDQFVGETFYSQMLQSMHKMAGKPAYFNGGRAEEVFQGQLDQVLSQKMTESNPGQFSGSMYELSNLNRK